MKGTKRRLIVNADGLGFTSGINRGIIETIKKGIVRSTSALANFPAIEEAASLFREVENIASVGIHFNLTVGKPVLPLEKINSLVNSKGEFWGGAFLKRLLRGKIKISHMIMELDAQVQKLVSLGFKLTHFDSHQGKHLYPPFFFAAIFVANKWGIKKLRSGYRYYFFLQEPQLTPKKLAYLSNPRRLFPHLNRKILMLYAKLKGFRMSDRLITPVTSDPYVKTYKEVWIKIIENLPLGTSEIFAHPGYITPELSRYSKIVNEREGELKALTDPDVINAVEKNQIEIISFREL
jgi:predicted glycoside hydrolase/deacetylase ChbG (UPF0249 family)